MHPFGVALVAGVVGLGLSGCGPQEEAVNEGAREVTLGPVDGLDLPAADLDRVAVGQTTPDFSLASLAGPTVTISDFRGEKNVILVFYRGHW